MEMETTFPFREREETALCDYLQAQFQKGWSYVEKRTTKGI